MQSNNILPTQNVQVINEDEIDLKRIFFMFLRHWSWFVICILVTLTGAYFYNRHKQQAYLIDTKIIVPEYNRGFDMKNLFETSMTGGTNIKISNEMVILHSYTLNRQVLENMNWRTSCYLKKLFLWQGLYTNEPFIVQELSEGNNVEGIDIFIIPIDDQNYTVKTDGTGVIDNEPVKIKFSATGSFGKPFSNDYFHFIIHPRESNPPLIDEEYFFRFNNLNVLTHDYLGRLNIELNDKQGEALRLSLTGTEPLREIQYLNELIRVYIDQKLEFQTETQKRSIQFIDKQLGGISDSLSAAGSTFSEFRSRNQIIDISAEGELVMRQLGEIEKERSQSQMQLEYFRNLSGYLGKADAIKQMVSPSVVGINDPALNSLVLKLSELYSRREVLSFSARENTPTLVLLNREIDQTTNQLHDNLVNLIDNAQLTIKSLDRRRNEISRQLNNLPVKEQQLVKIQRQYELTSDIYTFLLQRRAEIDISLASEVSEVQIIDPARIERIQKTGTSASMIYAIAFLLGLVLPGMVIIVGNMLTNTIHFQEDVEKLTSITIIGNVLHSRSKSELVVVDSPRSPIAESYRTIRTNLQYMLTQKKQKVIGIHSVRPGEGKSFTSTNLACILAMNDKKVLLIGADMRKPRLHQMINRPNKEGLSTYLIGQSTYEQILQESLIDNLWIITSGPVPPNPSELLERDTFHQLLERVKTDFDYIILDNAPMSFVTDGLITSREADLNIFILRYGISRKDQLKYINDMVAQGTLKHPALVINDIKLEGMGGYGYNYSYKYSYGKGYYGEEENHSNRKKN
jgi:capsular exopolysaccharide synthesis family protein